MRAQISLTPAESKKLIAMAVARMGVVKQSLERGMIVMHPSSSTYFIVEELVGHKPTSNAWVCGVIVPKGACVELGTTIGSRSVFSERPEESSDVTPEAFRHSWVIRGGKLSVGTKLGDLLAEMGPNDVYIKGINALDPQGKVGVLIGNPAEGGTIGRVIAASQRNGFTVIFPAGLEKLVPISIERAAKEARPKGLDYAMGIPVGLLSCAKCTRGIVVTEVRAIELLCGAIATPIAAGGLGGAEGAVTLVLTGDSEQVTQAISFAESSKAAELPQVRTYNCHECPARSCTFSVVDKPWL